MSKLLVPFILILALMLVSLASFLLCFCVLDGQEGCDLGIFEEPGAGILTLVGYAISLVLLWAGWRWTAKKEGWRRPVLRTGLVAGLLAPSVFSDPGVSNVFITPAWMPALVYGWFPPV